MPLPPNPDPSGKIILPIIALIGSQLFTSSWHVLGKHVLAQVPYLAPISYCLVRTLISSIFLLVVGSFYEGGAKPFPLFRNCHPAPLDFDLQRGSLKPPTSSPGGIQPTLSTEILKNVTRCHSASSINEIFSGTNKSGGDQQQTSLASLQLQQKYDQHHRPRRKRGRPSFKKLMFLLLRDIFSAVRIYQQQIIKTLNPESLQIICAGLSGMLLLPVCYTTGLLLTSPTVASVWDGPMIPVSVCLARAVTFK